jgi:hypothetical protein
MLWRCAGSLRGDGGRRGRAGDRLDASRSHVVDPALVRASASLLLVPDASFRQVGVVEGEGVAWGLGALGALHAPFHGLRGQRLE